MIDRLQTHCLLRPEDIAPSQDDLEVVGVFNPGAVRFADEIAILARVAERPRPRDGEGVPLTRYDLDAGRVAVDWAPECDYKPIDPRLVRCRDGTIRLTFISHLRLFFSRDGVSIDREGPGFFPENEYEVFGVEDPRITRIGERFYVTYVAVSPFGVCSSIASTEDFKTWRRDTPAFVPENKDVVLFPEKIDDEYVALHRPNPSSRFAMPEMWLGRSPDLVHWGRHQRFLGGADHRWATGRIGGGAPPVLTDRGWLVVYHGNDKSSDSGDAEIGAYYGAALLLDREDPMKIIGHTDEPFLKPEADFEREGFVDRVVFPTAVVEQDEQYLVYYGAADDKVGVVAYARDALLDLL